MRCHWVRAPLALLKTEHLRAAQGMDLGDDDSDRGVGGHGVGRHGGWQPGFNCGSFLDARAAPPQIQAQVLIANCYLNLKRLTPVTCKAVWS